MRTTSDPEEDEDMDSSKDESMSIPPAGAEPRVCAECGAAFVGVQRAFAGHPPMMVFECGHEVPL